MAEEEDIIIIDEADASGIDVAGDDTARTSADDEESDRKKKRLILIIAGAIIMVLLILIIVLLMMKMKPDAPVADVSMEQIESGLEKEVKVTIPTSQLEKMITKANYLYGNGNQVEALKLYEKIAVYSEAISQYNLGVAQLKEGEYAKALENFKNAIAKGEHRCVSAINAAVCALNLKDEKSFRYYIDMAHAFLPYENHSPLYSYYYALINYYRGNYLEALSALNHPSSEEYHAEQNRLKSKIDGVFGNYHEAISALEEIAEPKDAATLGTFYANIGDLTLAKEHLLKAIQENPKGFREQLALSYVYLKSGLLEEGGNLIKTINDMYGQEMYVPYPVRVFLKPELFEPDVAQRHYRNKVLTSRNIQYQQIFYFAPYKVFNAEQTISYIRKGNANIYIDDISSAKEYLQKSSQTSTVNYGIAQAIQKALSFHLKEANKEFQALQEAHPRHSILNYNLALTYAQQGDFVNAHKYFLKSYYLDANNYLSGLFAIMASQIIDQPNPKLVGIIKENLAKEDESEEFALYRTLLDFSRDNFVGTLPWLEKQYSERPLYLILNYLIATQVDRYQSALDAAEKLKNRQKNDILPHLIYLNAKLLNLDTKAYAKESLSYIRAQKFEYEDLYFGPFLTRYLFSQMALMTGTLHPLREQLNEKLEATTGDPSTLMQTLALTSIYDQAFENAYLIYNQLIDSYKERDSMTLFLASVASIGANHHANGIALLELAKLKNPNNMESRYALGLLYLESKNAQGASIQFKNIGNSGFISQYFDFEINTDQLLFERRQKMATP